MNEIRSIDNGIVKVFQSNLREAFIQIIATRETFPYIAIDTEYTGVINKPFRVPSPEVKYSYIKSNVDSTKIIQLGLTLMNEKGELASPISTWEFNFRVDIWTDTFSWDAREFLLQQGVIDFEALKTDGVLASHFKRQMLKSGCLRNPQHSFIFFQGEYDIFYLLKLMKQSKLPLKRIDACRLIKKYFGQNVFDLKFLILHNRQRKSWGLSKLADDLKVDRVGAAHSAGSDSRLTGETFFAAKNKVFSDGQLQHFKGKLSGFDVFRTVNGEYHYY